MFQFESLNNECVWNKMNEDIHFMKHNIFIGFHISNPKKSDIIFRKITFLSFTYYTIPRELDESFWI